MEFWHVEHLNPRTTMYLRKFRNFIKLFNLNTIHYPKMNFPLQVLLDNRPRRHPYFLNSQSQMFHRYPHNTIIPLLLVAVLNVPLVHTCI